ncbi:hypothetical protein NXC14_PA00347 (plasmid) [Rhizobium sp. NXC14]|nr:hypothetical protein NXC14_PA00347 [Rhizobium sp. NXC14]
MEIGMTTKTLETYSYCRVCRIRQVVNIKLMLPRHSLCHWKTRRALFTEDVASNWHDL